MEVNHQPRILLAEDDPNLGLLLSEFLKKKGFDVTWAQNGDQALGYFVDGQFDLCLLDVMMPVMDGITALQHIRSRQAQTGTTHTPIMILSAHAMLGDRENMLAAGADAYLAKPIAITSMREEISRLMDSRLHAGSLG
jgi:CheY-like chemotaxis protein